MVSSKCENFTVRTIVIRQSPWDDMDPAKHLIKYIEELSQKDYNESDDHADDRFNRTGTVHFELNLLCVHLTPRIMKLLIELLNVALVRGGEQDNPSSPNNDGTNKWHSVVLNQCRIVEHSAYFPLDKEDLTIDDISRFGSTLASRVSSITIQDSPGLLDCLLHADQKSWTMAALFLRERKGIGAIECSKLGEFIQSSPSIKVLNLHSTFLEAPEQLGRGLANARHLEVLCLGNNFGLCRSMKERRNGLAALVVGGMTKELVEKSGSSNTTSTSLMTGAVAQLLQDPQSRLKRLDLSSLDLDDDHLIAISQLLCTRSSHHGQHTRDREDMVLMATAAVGGGGSGSRLEELNVSFNRLYSRSIFEFARLLPHMKFLRKATLGPNPWDECLRANQCKTALLHGLIQSLSVEFLDIFMTKTALANNDSDNDHDGSLSSSVVHYHVLLNRAGRRILTSIDPVPLGLWSQILHRAGTTISYPPPPPSLTPPPSSPPSTTSGTTATTTTTTQPNNNSTNVNADSDSDSSMLRMVSEHECRASAVFYLLSNGPILISTY